MIHLIKKVVVAALLLALTSPSARAQTQSWYVGLQGGTSFGQCTFRSITETRVSPGFQGGAFGGYRFNRLLSLEAGLQIGAQTQWALNCCQYWLSENGERYMSPVVDRPGWYYHQLNTRTQWGKLGLQLNADLLSLITAPDCRWSLNVGPQVSAVTTRTTLVTPDRGIAHDRQWHLGLGGQASLGFRISERIGAALYGGITCLTGERFDNIPEHAHKSNLFWDAGARLILYL